nr:outer membrane beta-barrel protein [uncultured Mucilaginibacter sp.]
MKKILLATLLFVGVAATSFAQDGGKFSVGVEAGLPVGDVSNAFNFVIGGSLKYDLPIATATNFTISAGYSSFQGKSISGFKIPAAGFVPVKAGIKYFFAESFYGEAQVGAAFSTQSGGGTAFAYSPGIGYKFSDVVDLGIRYEAWSKDGTVGQIGARLGFSF